MEVGPHAAVASAAFDRTSANMPAFSFANHSDFLTDPPQLQKLADAAPPMSPAANLTRNPSNSAAMRVQRVYRSYRTRRMLADSAVVAEELWWQALDFARLNHSTISFSNFLKPETAASRWNRVSLNASKVGKGLSQDIKAQQLAFQHWIEAIDPRHRYGHNLHYYYEEWCKANAGQPFFYWLDLGDGREVDLKECPRSKLRQQCIKYLGPKEREHYEYVVDDGKILHKLTGNPLSTNEASPGSKWIFVISTSKKLYIGEKKKGHFHHSSFLAGGATLAAGRVMAEGGVLKCISACSRHYKPTYDRLDTFLSILRENGINLDEVEVQHIIDHLLSWITFFIFFFLKGKNARGLLISEIRWQFSNKRCLQRGRNLCEHYRVIIRGMRKLRHLGGHLITLMRRIPEQHLLKLAPYLQDSAYKRILSFQQSKWPITLIRVGDIVQSVSSSLDSFPCDLPNEEEEDLPTEETEAPKPVIKTEYKRTLSGGLQSPKADIPRKAILQRINSKKTKSYQLGHQLSNKWSTGAGPRIGCIADYPMELRLQALELTNLSPRSCPPVFTPRRMIPEVDSPTHHDPLV